MAASALASLDWGSRLLNPPLRGVLAERRLGDSNLVRALAVIKIENQDSQLIVLGGDLKREALSLLLRRWKCLDDDACICNEYDYRVHNELHPDHKIVIDLPEVVLKDTIKWTKAPEL